MSIEGEVLSSAMGQKEQIDQRTREEKNLGIKRD